MSTSTPLTAAEMSYIEFERARWKHEGAKRAAIWDLFGLKPERYSQILVVLMQRPEAEAYDPATVRRFRDLQDRRRLARSARARGVDLQAGASR